MFRTLLLFVVVLISAPVLQAQKNSGTINGIIRDSIFATPPLGNGRVAGASVTLMKQKDSSLVTFTMTDTAGVFSLKGIAYGSYRLLVTHTAYRSLSKIVLLSADTPVVALNSLYLIHRSVQLNEFVVEDEAPPITLKGDTLEFNAASFKTATNASSEELMKKLPGFQIASDGSYMVNGQKVTKILVDGKEFFSDDPSLAGKNLPADAIKKVQVFQKASETEMATGVKDGSSETTINLTLKDDKKAGGFGSVMAAAGTDNRYQTAMNYNRFNGAKRFSVLANTNNINERAFSFQDMINMSGGFNQGGGGFRTFSDDGSGGFGGTSNGINTAWAGGINFANDFGKRVSVSGNYFFTRRSRELISESVRNYALPDSIFTRNSNSQLNNYNDNHRLNITTEFRYDSLTKFRMRTSLTYSNSRSYSYNGFSTSDALSRMINSGSSGNFSGRDAYAFNNEITFSRKMRRTGRNFSINWKVNERVADNFSEPENSTTFFTENNGAFSKVIRQRNRQNENRDEQTVTSTWTEPVGRYSKMLFTVQALTRTARNDRNVYAVDTLDNLTLIFQPNLSNDFALTFRYASFSTRYNYEKKKHSLTFGGSVLKSQLNGILLDQPGSTSSSFLNFMPYARYAYNITKHKKFELNYYADISPPDASDLNPVKDVSDPLIIYSGNTALRPEVFHQVNLQFFAPDPTGGSSYFLGAYFTHTQHAIITSTTLDTLGRQVSMPVNGKPSDAANIYANYFTRFEKLKSGLDISVSVNTSRDWSVINGANNQNLNLGYNGDAGWRFNPTDSFELRAEYGFSVSDGRYSLLPQRNNQFITQTMGGSVLWQTKPGINFESNFNYTIATNQSTGVQTKFPLWTASASWSFLKENRGELKLSVFDILNTNTGIEQNVDITYVEIQRYNTLKRYIMLGFTYKIGATLDANAKGMRRMMIRH
jgi:Outer membrane protein beta-barrel family